MNDYKFGTKEIIATLCACILMVCERFIVLWLQSKGVVDEQLFDWIRLRTLIVAMAAVFFGPICGFITGLGGGLLVSVIFGNDISYPGMFVLGFYGFFLGLYFGKKHYDKNHFTIRTFFDFNAVQIMVGILCSIFLVPLLEFMINDADLYEGVMSGTKRAIGSVAIIGLLCPLAMLIAGLCAKPRNT